MPRAACPPLLCWPGHPALARAGFVRCDFSTSHLSLPAVPGDKVLFYFVGGGSEFCCLLPARAMPAEGAAPAQGDTPGVSPLLRDWRGATARCWHFSTLRPSVEILPRPTHPGTGLARELHLAPGAGTARTPHTHLQCSHCSARARLSACQAKLRVPGGNSLFPPGNWSVLFPRVPAPRRTAGSELRAVPDPQNHPKSAGTPVNLNTQTLFKLILPLWRPQTPPGRAPQVRGAAGAGTRSRLCPGQGAALLQRCPQLCPFLKPFPACQGGTWGHRAHTHPRCVPGSAPTHPEPPPRSRSLPREEFWRVTCVALEDLSPSIIFSPGPDVGALPLSRWILPLPKPGFSSHGAQTKPSLGA